MIFRSPLARYDLFYAFSSIKTDFDKHCHIVHKFAEDIIKQRRNELVTTTECPTVSNRKKYLDFIDVLLAAKV